MKKSLFLLVAVMFIASPALEAHSKDYPVTIKVPVEVSNLMAGVTASVTCIVSADLDGSQKVYARLSKDVPLTNGAYIGTLEISGKWQLDPMQREWPMLTQSDYEKITTNYNCQLNLKYGEKTATGAGLNSNPPEKEFSSAPNTPKATRIQGTFK